jgi:hypothetical protein
VSRARLNPLVLAGATLIAASLALTGCSAGSTHTAATAVPNLPQKNIDQWVLPLDNYIVGDTKASDYAGNLLVAPCVEKAGYSWNQPYRDITAGNGASFNSVGRRLFNPSIAEKWGYHFAPSPDTTLAAANAFNASANAISPAEQTVVTKCIVQSRKTLPILSGSALIGANYASEAYDAAVSDSAVKAAASKWRACMVPAGISDIPATPEDFPSASVTSRFGLGRLVLSNTPPDVTPAEIKLATFDANCEESSGYLPALYKTEWDHQVTLMSKNADALDRAKTQLDTYNAKVQKVISTHAPQH